jgi:ABC-2 type transport system ATP-binding protein
VRQQFTGVITQADEPDRRQWSWRRGRRRREYWPDGGQPAHLTVVEPDLEDIVIALSLVRRAAARATT